MDEYKTNGMITVEQGLPAVDILKRSTSEKGGVLKNDQNNKIKNVSIYSNSDVVKMIQEFPQVSLLIKRKGQSDLINKVIQLNEDHKVGIAFGMPKIKEVKEIKLPIHKSFLYSLVLTKELTFVSVKSFGNLLVNIVTKAEIPNGISGPVGIGGAVHHMLELGKIKKFISFIALLSLSLGIMNILPIPALDGGRLVFLLIEAIIRRPIKAKWETMIHTASFALLLLLILIISLNDVINLIK